MWDQSLYSISYRVKVTTASTGINNSAAQAAAVALDQQDGSGPLSNAATGVLGFERLSPEDLRRDFYLDQRVHNSERIGRTVGLMSNTFKPVVF